MIPESLDDNSFSSREVAVILEYPHKLKECSISQNFFFRQMHVESFDPKKFSEKGSNCYSTIWTK